MHFVDLNEKAASVGELRRFAQKFGIAALIDRDSKRFAELGLRSAMLGDERWLEKLSLEPLLLNHAARAQPATADHRPRTGIWNAWYVAAKP